MNIFEEVMSILSISDLSSFVRTCAFKAGDDGETVAESFFLVIEDTHTLALKDQK